MKKNFIVIIILLIFILLAGIVLARIFEFSILPSQIAGALFGVIITVLITGFLLNGQTKSESEKERNMKIFEKKQDVYHEFLKQFQKIIQNGEITISAKKADGSIDKNIDELKDLIFQLGYLQLHTEKAKIDDIMENIGEIVKRMQEFQLSQDKEKELPQYYSSLSKLLFEIIAILRSDLYGKEAPPEIDENKFEGIIASCGFFIENQVIDKHRAQEYFWDQLQDLLIQRGYHIEKKSFKDNINQYYAKARNRHRWYGIDLKIPIDNKDIRFHIGIDNEYYYGFPKEGNTNFNEDKLIQCINEISSAFKAVPGWFGFKRCAGRYYLNFWKMWGFEKWKSPKAIEKFMYEVVDEIDKYIKDFQKIAENKGL